MKVLAEKPWAYPMMPPPKESGRPAGKRSRDNIDFCLNRCPFPDEEGCRHSVAECMRLAKRAPEAQPQEAGKALFLPQKRPYIRARGDEFTRRMVGNTVIYTHVRKGHGTHYWDGQKYREICQHHIKTP